MATQRVLDSPVPSVLTSTLSSTWTLTTDDEECVYNGRGKDSIKGRLSHISKQKPWIVNITPISPLKSPFSTSLSSLGSMASMNSINSINSSRGSRGSGGYRNRGRDRGKESNRFSYDEEEESGNDAITITSNNSNDDTEEEQEEQEEEQEEEEEENVNLIHVIKCIYSLTLAVLACYLLIHKIDNEDYLLPVCHVSAYIVLISILLILAHLEAVLVAVSSHSFVTWLI